MVVELKSKFDGKVREYNGLKVQLGIVEETNLAREKVLKSLEAELQDSKAQNESLSIDNSRLGLIVTDTENRNDELVLKLENQVTDHQDSLVLNQLTEKLKEKDVEIIQLKETIEFTEKSVSEAKDYWKKETAQVKHLQSLLDNEKILRIQHQEECGSLKMRLDEEKAKLERNKSPTPLCHVFM